MSRQEYTVPTGAQGSAFGASSSLGGGGRDGGASEPMIKYQCGDCGSPNQLKKADPIQCKDCGCRVLYKERTKR